ncbi:hypothetical protein, conserved [Trypanosoma brucei gambiense DAL972]|uniref:EF-hand domain-containing protein n=1 Tax=Trypanosoma brucei gambiense (strain MHOM/CI/86/DAL972) TaxID=679716 RepID=C9ZPP3_TRYB9|nr:hypothetical protein, conserved [Trypanosoma brucei gambiense DAL972]CBH11371.1 hypothetical protein, conserved [Trypanosoma brucei gambiense DAL972]|eukprot:XP_011773658.1 hypothetical protein, conserved [Trypanosoma brucei gambiense DAL972]
MNAAVVTNVGVVVDVVIVARCLDDAELAGVEGRGSSLESTTDVIKGASTSFSVFSSRKSSSRGVYFITDGNASVTHTNIGDGTGMTSCDSSDLLSIPVASSILNDDVHYECRAVKRPLPQCIFHHFDVLPFGVISPSAVFAVLGRHTNRGLVTAITTEGLFVVRRYASGAPLKITPRGLDRKRVTEEDVEIISTFSKSDAVDMDIKTFMSIARQYKERYDESNSGNADNYNQDTGRTLDSSNGSECLFSDESENGKWRTPEDIEYCALRELQLAPSLALHDPVPPLRVGSRVIARRSCSGISLHIARVCRVNYDVTYTLVYESDGATETGVLHNDVHLLDESEAEQCSVRDNVTVILHKQRPAVIIECCGDENYRVIIDQNRNQAVSIKGSNIVFVAPLLKEALYADPVILRWFRELDRTRAGVVEWKDVRHLILSWEGYDTERTFRKIGEAQRDLCLRLGCMEPQLMKRVPVQMDEMQLRFPEFEYVILRLKNLF